jgi:hypothetical protein
MASFDEKTAFLGLAGYRRLEDDYLPDERIDAKYGQ